MGIATILLSFFVGGCATSPTPAVEYRANTIIIQNPNQCVLRVFRNGAPWTYEVRGMGNVPYDLPRLVPPSQTLVLTNCSSADRESITIGLVAEKTRRVGCVPEVRHIGAMSMRIDIGTQVPAIAIVVHRRDLR